MNLLLMFLLVVVTAFEYLGKSGVLPLAVKYIPDILSATVLLIVVVLGTRNRFQHLRAAYWFVFGLVALTMISGALANSLQPGPMFTGVRYYIRAVPLFLLPAVYEFRERDIRRQLQLVLALCILQGPIAFRQWMARGPGEFSGDTITGTLLLSGTLSVFLICGACVLTGAWLRKRLALKTFLPLFLLMLAPTTINETKATFVILPIGLLVTFIVAAPRGARLKNIIFGAGLIALCAAIFIPIYDTYGTGRAHGTPIIEFFTNERKLDLYMNRDAGVGAPQAGRVEALATALREISKEPSRFMIGFGIGNTGRSPLGEQFTGAYALKFQPITTMSATVYMLEIGMLGLVLTLVLAYLIYGDARAVAQADHGLVGALAAGWAGVTVVVVTASFYINVGVNEAIAFMFWYFSGLIAAHRMRRIPAATDLSAHASGVTGSS